MAHDVFVSYSQPDKTTAEAVCAALEAHAFRCWIAPRDIPPGEEWGGAIIEAINSVRAMVLIFSANANSSRQIKLEVERAVSKGVPVIPFRIEDVTPSKNLEYFLMSRQWLNAYPPPLEQHLKYLAEVVQRIVSGPGSAAPPERLPSPRKTPGKITLKRMLAAAILLLAIAIIAIGIRFWKQVSPECSPNILRDQLFRAGPDKGVVIKTTARAIREKFRLQQFACVADLAAVFLETDSDNGHGLYFAGEVWRVKAKQDPKHSDLCRDRMREHFFRYLANEPALPAGERDGNGKLCYEREKGYCAERTAWINHVMAIDYFQQAADSRDNGTKIMCLKRAANFVKIDLAFGGFDQITPSSVLRDKVGEELQRLGSSYPADL